MAINQEDSIQRELGKLRRVILIGFIFVVLALNGPILTLEIKDKDSSPKETKLDY